MVITYEQWISHWQKNSGRPKKKLKQTPQKKKKFNNFIPGDFLK